MISRTLSFRKKFKGILCASIASVALLVAVATIGSGTGHAQGRQDAKDLPSPASAIAPAPHSAACGVTDKLVNTCRPWLGANANKYNVASNYRAQIEAHEAAIGRKVDIVHTYHPVGSNQLSPYDKYFISRPGTYLFTNWKPAERWRDAGGNSARTNRAIDTMADSIKSVGNKKIFLTVHHEPENDVSRGGTGCNITYKGNAGTPAEYRAMWQNVRKRFDAKGVKNVVWVIDYMNYSRWDCLVDDMYPGNHLVDWVMFNAYGSSDRPDAKANIQHFVDLLAKYQSKERDFNSKPWGIVEWNVHNISATASYRYYDDMKAIANNNTFPKLKLFMVFDSIGPDGDDNRIAYVDGRRDETRLARYRSLANSPIFSGQ